MNGRLRNSRSDPRLAAADGWGSGGECFVVFMATGETNGGHTRRGRGRGTELGRDRSRERQWARSMADTIDPLRPVLYGRLNSLTLRSSTARSAALPQGWRPAGAREQCEFASSPRDVILENLREVGLHAVRERLVRRTHDQHVLGRRLLLRFCKVAVRPSHPQVERRDARSTRAEDFFDAFRAGRATPGRGAGRATARCAAGAVRHPQCPTPITTLPIFCPLST